MNALSSKSTSIYWGYSCHCHRKNTFIKHTVIAKIAFIHKGGAYLPELIAYQAFFEARGHRCMLLKHPDEEALLGVDIEWHFLGFDFAPKRSDRLKVHEYASLSVPPFAKIKDTAKSVLNTKPHVRVLQASTAARFAKDDVPAFVKRYGISSDFFHLPSRPADFDFVYVGAMDATRQLQGYLSHWVQHFPDYTLLMIGEPPAHLFKRFKKHSNIQFTGRIAYAEVPHFLSGARYGLNLIPDRSPYNIQDSLKLMEYCAAGLKVITTDYAWAKAFEERRQARFLKLSPDLSNFNPASVENYDFSTPDVSDLLWEKVLLDAKLHLIPNI
ncbi:MAG: glycosyltransferase [Saprospiraceae bacterium]